MKFENQVAIVTGAGRPYGIGEAIASRLARAGAHVVVVDICRERPDLPRERFGQWDDLQAIAGGLEALGQRGLALQADVTDEGEVAAMVGRVVAEFGRIDILCNNAGGGTGAGPADSTPVADLSLTDWNYTLGVSLTSTFLCSKHTAKAMIEGGLKGRIVNTVSVAAHHGVIGCSAYSAAKLGVVSLTKTLALELAPHGIRVNAFSPGVTDTPYVRQRVEGIAQSNLGATPERVLADWVKSVPLGRAAMPQEMAAVAEFLASEDSSYITGQTLWVDGGLTAR